MACKYDLILDGNKTTYEDEFSLNSHLSKMARKTDTTKFDSYMFSLSDKSKELIDSLEKLQHSKRERGLTGVNDFLEQPQIINGSEKLLLPVYIQENRINEYINSHKDVTSEVARAEILDIIDKETKMTSFGILIHNLLNHGLSLGINSPEFQKELSRLDNSEFDEVFKSNTTEDIDVKKKVMTTIQSLLDFFSKYDYVIPELTVTSEEPKSARSNGLVGRMDIVAVDKSGLMHIFDLKLSTKTYEHWDSAKKLHTDYQLAIYRQMMAAKGFKVNSSALNVIPVTMQYGNINTLTSQIFLKNRTANSGKGGTGLNYESGTISNTVRELIPAIINKAMIEDSKVAEKIVGDLQSILPKYTSRSKRENNNVEEILKHHLNKNDKGKFRYNGKYYSTEVELKEAIQSWVSDSDSRKTSNVQDLKTQLEQHLNAKTIPTELMNVKDPIKNNILTLNFEKYTQGEWRILDLDELTNLGVLAFENIRSGVVEFVSITSDAMDYEHNLGRGSTLLGKFKTNDQASNYQGKILAATTKNLEIIKVLTAINTMPTIFKDKTLGNIKVLNYEEGKEYTANLEVSISNFNILANEAKIANNFTNNFIKVTDLNDYIESEIDFYLSSTDNELFQNDLGVLRADVSLSKLQKFIELKRILEERYPQELAGKKYIDQMNFSTKQEKLYALVTYGIQYYSGISILGDTNVTN